LGLSLHFKKEVEREIDQISRIDELLQEVESRERIKWVFQSVVWRIISGGKNNLEIVDWRGNWGKRRKGEVRRISGLRFIPETNGSFDYAVISPVTENLANQPFEQYTVTLADDTYVDIFADGETVNVTSIGYESGEDG